MALAGGQSEGIWVTREKAMYPRTSLGPDASRRLGGQRHPPQGRLRRVSASPSLGQLGGVTRSATVLYIGPSKAPRRR